MAHLPHVLLISQSLTNQPVAFFCFLSSTLYPSYQQQGITNFQTLLAPKAISLLIDPPLSVLVSNTTGSGFTTQPEVCQIYLF